MPKILSNFYSPAFLAAQAFSVFEIMTSSIIRKNARYSGIKRKLIWFAISPKSGGMKVEPTYALAICMPIMPCEFSAPKFAGVEWMMQG